MAQEDNLDTMTFDIGVLAIQMGFSSEREMYFCISNVSLKRPEDLALFVDWQDNDCTKRGLLRRFRQLCRLQRAGDISGDDYVELDEEWRNQKRDRLQQRDQL